MKPSKRSRKKEEERRDRDAHSLSRYATKRSVERSGEPAAKSSRSRSSNGLSYCVHKHAASTLHYDFRLELGGTLKSWAIPKGPSLAPSDKRLAVHVEDHPLDYRDFEGVIPEAEYGGGTVQLWDRGTWEPEDDDPEGHLARGELGFTLHGEKLRGAWKLVRMKGRESGGQVPWLLIKIDDEEAQEDASFLDEHPASVRSGKLLAEIAREGRASEEQIAKARAADRGKARRGGATKKSGSSRRRSEKKSVPLTHPDKVLFEDVGATKADLARHWERVADLALPHLKDRPLMLVRCPDGANDDCFVQKHPRGHEPEGLLGTKIPAKRGEELVLLVRDETGLRAIAQLGVLEVHIWGSRVTDLERPDRLTFDLDPGPGIGSEEVAAAAREVRDRLAQRGLESHALATGSLGIHVVVPLVPKASFDEVREFAKSVARSMAADSPERYVAQSRKDAREERIFVDYLRNGRGATAIAPFSTRARPDAPVAIPLRWREVRKDLDPSGMTSKKLPRRLGNLRGDPWEGYAETRQGLPR